MDIWHRITFSHRDNVDSTIEALGLKYKKNPFPGEGYLIHIDIYESAAAWPQIEALVRQKNALDVFDTIFAPEEILHAEWVRLVPIFEQGYPQPYTTWVTNPINYKDHCPACGTFQQAASFRLKKELNLGRKDFVSLYWTYALFCAPYVFDELEAHGIRGYEKWDAIIHKTDVPSQKVSQLYVPTIANPGLVKAEGLRREKCSACGLTKYYPHMKGVMYLAREALVPDTDIIQTHEWFGSGRSAYREVLISNRFAKLILEKGWQGIRLKVVELL
jgi:hypothetical protein